MNNQMWLHSSINTKSWKEYVGKRERGRSSDQPGMDTKALADAKAGIGLLNITQIDSRAWDTLKAVCPKYQSDYFTLNQRHNRRKAPTTTTNESIGMCVFIKKDQEAYLDEFVSYHLALGFASVYIYGVHGIK